MEYVCPQQIDLDEFDNISTAPTLETLFNLDKFSENYHEEHSSYRGGRLNKKDGLTRYDNSHVKDKMS